MRFFLGVLLFEAYFLPLNLSTCLKSNHKKLLNCYEKTVKYEEKIDDTHLEVAFSTLKLLLQRRSCCLFFFDKKYSHFNFFLEF